ncbi:MAG: DNA-protecting protein DprA [Acidimicrobiia bacterium]|nr:DNA-protecting protein DprA [Acidimicrobiia bacterium]
MNLPIKADSPVRHLVQSRSSLIAAIRLCALSSLGVARSRWLLHDTEPEQVVECLLRGRLPAGLPDPRVSVTQSHVHKWQAGLRAQMLEDLIARNLNGPHRIIDAGCAEWPFTHDPDPPILLFVHGRRDLLENIRRVAVVGTRRCSAVGTSVAGEIGWTLAEHGVSVVSGLALGIDGAAHRGAGSSSSDPGRIGVVAGGLDVVYPTGNKDLWESVARSGVLLTETPVGERPTRWRFPARNRLIAGLSELVVVVESHAAGGALHTVDEALKRNIDVVAVPGSVRARSCGGTNQLLMDGLPPVRGGEDLVDLLGLNRTRTDSTGVQVPTCRSGSDPDQSAVGEPRPDQSRDEAILDALEGGPTSTDSLAAATGIEISALLALIQRLKRSERVEINGSLIAKAMTRGE